MKSWKTTLFGILTAAAGGVATTSTDPQTGKWAMLIGAICTGLMGIFSRDNKVTSEQAGAKDGQ
jgi:hypothetical protein